MQEGDLFIANPDTYHEIRSLRSRNLELFFLCFYITRHTDKSRVSQQLQVNQGYLANFLLDHQLHLPSQSHLVPLFEHAMKLMRLEPEYPKNRFYHEATLFLINQVLAALTSMSSSRADFRAQQHRNRIVEMIEEELHQTLRIAQLAKACGMSERTLRRKWNKWSTRSLSEEINHRRVERACQLLLLPDISIANVGYQVGIGDPAQFSRLFKKMKDCSPGAYRRRHLDNIPGVISKHKPFETEYLGVGRKKGN